MFPVAAALLAGEGLAGVFGALLTVADIDGSVDGTAARCPSFEHSGQNLGLSLLSGMGYYDASFDPTYLMSADAERLSCTCTWL